MTMPEWEKFKPIPTEDTAPYWEYCAQGELRMQRCGDCGHVRFPPSPLCPRCLSRRNEWARLSGRGRVWSWVIFHQAYYPGYADDVPYNTAIVELDEGPRMHTNIVGCANEDVQIGMPVEVVFEALDEEIQLPKFRPTSGSART
jgi:uncharacterized OB-fold protein